MYACVYIYDVNMHARSIHTYIHTYIHTNVHTYIHTHTHICVYTYVIKMNSMCKSIIGSNYALHKTMCIYIHTKHHGHFAARQRRTASFQAAPLHLVLNTVACPLLPTAYHAIQRGAIPHPIV